MNSVDNSGVPHPGFVDLSQSNWMVQDNTPVDSTFRQSLCEKDPSGTKSLYTGRIELISKP